MEPYKLDKFPAYARIELEKIQLLVAPLVKKSTMYRIVSILLMSVSFTNLAFILWGETNYTMIALGVFSVLAAIGMALYKEAVYQNREIQKTSLEYIKGRMQRSTTLPQVTRDHYMEQIDIEPRNAIPMFFEFLNKEERMRKRNEAAAAE